jgi:hypothetical protein
MGTWAPASMTLRVASSNEVDIGETVFVGYISVIIAFFPMGYTSLSLVSFCSFDLCIFLERASYHYGRVSCVSNM